MFLLRCPITANKNKDCEKYTKTIPARIQTVIKAKGGHIKYEVFLFITCE